MYGDLLIVLVFQMAGGDCWLLLIVVDWCWFDYIPGFGLIAPYDLLIVVTDLRFTFIYYPDLRLFVLLRCSWFIYPLNVTLVSLIWLLLRLLRYYVRLLITRCVVGWFVVIYLPIWFVGYWFGLFVTFVDSGYVDLVVYCLRYVGFPTLYPRPTFLLFIAFPRSVVVVVTFTLQLPFTLRSGFYLFIYLFRSRCLVRFVGPYLHLPFTFTFSLLLLIYLPLALLCLCYYSPVGPLLLILRCCICSPLIPHCCWFLDLIDGGPYLFLLWFWFTLFPLPFLLPCGLDLY